MNDEQIVKEYWDKKEKENNSKLIARTAAHYIEGYRDLAGPVPGLLYLMENGFYFENFKNNNFMSNIIQRNDDFEKINIHIPFTSITDVYDYFGNTKKEKTPFKKKLKYIFFSKPNELHIEYQNKNSEKNIIKFKTFIEPLLFCEEYYKLI